MARRSGPHVEEIAVADTKPDVKMSPPSPRSNWSFEFGCKPVSRMALVRAR
jgi:hypothetical protein